MNKTFTPLDADRSQHDVPSETSVGALRCVRCRSPIRAIHGADLECDVCGSSYPLVGGVPVMFADVMLEDARKPSGTVAEQILAAYELPNDAITVERIRALFSVRARYGDALIGTEAAQFIDRLRNTGHSIGQTSAPDDDQVDRMALSELEAPLEAGYPEWEADHIPRHLQLGTTVLANVRFRNVGDGIMPCDGEHPVAVSARWHDARGTPLPVPDHRTPLPVDLLPGRSLTLPVRIQAPDTMGRYRLTLVFVQEGVRWFEDAKLQLRVKVSGESRTEHPPGWWIRDEAPQSYDADHERGINLLRQWIAAFAPPRPRILEIGGNAVPMIERLDGELCNVDVDLLGLQICLMRQKQAKRAMTVVCADAGNLPFPPNSFDVITIFASLHHFPDPAAVLSRLRSSLRPGGFLAVMCEPVGHIWPGAVLPDYARELKRGANEQSFSTDEYAYMFRVAGLEILEAIVDKDSLKARLRPSSGC